MGSGKWDHSKIATGSLLKVADAATDFRMESKSGMRLVAHARVALRVRIGIKAEDWKAVVDIVNGVEPTSFEESCDEVAAARNELDDECAKREAGLEAALTKGRSQRLGHGWDHKHLQTAEVILAQKALTSFPHTTERGMQLLTQTALVLELRGVLQKSDWARAASWDALAQLLASYLQFGNVFIGAPNHCSDGLTPVWRDERGEVRQTQITRETENVKIKRDGCAFGPKRTRTGQADSGY